MAPASAHLLDLPASRGRLHALAHAGVLERDELERALAGTGRRPSPTSWTSYLYWHALIIGVVLVASGIIYFVAANWSGLPGTMRMAIVAVPMIAATLVGGLLGDSLAGRAASLLGGLCFGPLLAVHGQVYQTGADAWQLFAWWALVLLAHGALARFVGTWVAALVCLHVACATWMSQELGLSMFEGEGAYVIAGLALVDAGIVALAEATTKGREREVLIHSAGCFGLALVLPFGVLVVIGEGSAASIPGLLVLLGGLAGIWLVYRWRRPELGMLAALATVITILVSAALARVLLDGLDAELFGVALLGVFVCGQVWLFTRWLLGWRREHPRRRHELRSSTEAAGSARPRPSLGEVLALVAPAKLARASDPRFAEALHDDEAIEAPLSIRVFMAIGTWIGAAMVAAIFAALEIYEVVPLALVLALSLFVAAVMLARRPRRSLALTQSIWAMALGAHGLLLGAAGEVQLEPTTIAAGWTVLNGAMIFAIRVPSFALASAVCAVGFGTWLCSELDVSALWIALPAAALATWVWIDESGVARRLGPSWSALAHGLPIGVVGPLTLVGVDDQLGGLVALTHWSTTLASAVVLVLLGLVVHVARRERGGVIDRRALVFAGLALLAVVAARHVPGLSLALLWLALAHLRKSPGLQTLAAIQLAGFSFFFYYQLDTTLLLKSLWVISTGVVLLVGAFVANPERATRDPRPTRRESRWLPAILLVVATTGIVVAASLAKERVLATGEVVLLPLAPVDPRSLVQGDYMVLRYALEDELMPVPGEVPALPRHARLVVARDELGVGHFVRIDEGQPLAPGEVRIEYRLREGWNGRLRIGAESFFFEEGSADLYAGARYGELAVAEDGEVVLIGLRDEDREPLGIRLHPRVDR